MKRQNTFTRALTIILLLTLLLSCVGCGGSLVVTIAPAEDFEYHTASDGGVVIDEYIGSATKISIPSEIGGRAVTTISSNAFSGYLPVTEIVLPETVDQIDRRAFYGCSNLVKINLPEGIEIISEEAFRNCSSLKEITILNSVTRIEENVFKGCSVTVYAPLASAEYAQEIESKVNFDTGNVYWEWVTGAYDLEPDGVNWVVTG